MLYVIRFVQADKSPNFGLISLQMRRYALHLVKCGGERQAQSILGHFPFHFDLTAELLPAVGDLEFVNSYRESA